MASFGLDMHDIVDLDTVVATSGAMRGVLSADDVFEYIIAIAILIYEMFPG